jgi:predicted phosphodiesterase
MVITLVGDMHISDKKPSCRNDESYQHTCLDKFNQISLHPSDFILQAGDFFDFHSVSNALLGDIMLLTRLTGKPFYCVAGQHDMKFHSHDLRDTALRVIADSGYLQMPTTSLSIIDCAISFVSYNQEIPKPKKGKFNILVIHKMITKDGPLFPGHLGFVTARNFLKTHDYDLVLSGDNHKTFVEEYDGKILVNPGTVMRKTITDKDHKPCFFTFNTDTKELKQHFLKVDYNPFVEIDETKKTVNEQMLAFVENLKTKVKLEGVNFVDNLNILSIDQKDEIKTLLRRSLEHES